MSIEVFHVSKRFGPVTALSDVSLSIAPGERVAFVGTNGSGKTTLLRAMVGLLKVEGHIRIFGTDVARSPKKALQPLAYMPQVAPPLESPVMEMVRAFCTVRACEVGEVEAQLQMLGLKLSEIARSRVRDLSGGMKQKLLAALALAAKPSILVCDEPTANLDAEARESFFKAVNARAGDMTLVICSHRVDDVRHLVSRVVEFKEGRVARDVPVEAMWAEPHAADCSCGQSPAPNLRRVK